MKKWLVIGLILVLLILYICMVWFSGHSNPDNTSEPTTPTAPATSSNEQIEVAAPQPVTTPEPATSTEPTNDRPTTPEPVTTSNEDVVVPTDALSDGQKQLLETFGVDTENIVITPEMLACAEAEVGRERLEAIQAGETPTFFEGLALFGCYQ
jgi:cytoskeletal protein RodZ